MYIFCFFWILDEKWRDWWIQANNGSNSLSFSHLKSHGTPPPFHLYFMTRTVNWKKNVYQRPRYTTWLDFVFYVCTFSHKHLIGKMQSHSQSSQSDKSRPKSRFSGTRYSTRGTFVFELHLEMFESRTRRTASGLTWKCMSSLGVCVLQDVSCSIFMMKRKYHSFDCVRFT